MNTITASEAMAVIRELVEKFIDVDQGYLTSYNRMRVLNVLDDMDLVVEMFKD